MNFKKYLNIFLVLIFIIISLLYIFIANKIPISVFLHSMHDDDYFMSSANSIIDGKWLGKYNQMTLIKGPVYSFFLVLSNYSNLSIQLSHALLYLFSCLYLCYSINKKYVHNNVLILILFIILLYNPVLFPSRVIRDYIYTSLLFLVISNLILIDDNKNFIVPIFLGGSLFLFWYCREEGIFIIPLILIPIFNFLKSKSKTRFFKKIFLSLLVFFCLKSIVSYKNYKNYETTSIVDFKDTEFKTLLTTLNNIETNSYKDDHVPVSKEQRDLAYQASAHFHELENILESPTNGWKNIGCDLYPDACGDYAGGWFMWALRDAVAEKGYYKNPKMADNFYKQVNIELDNARINGNIQIDKSYLSYLPQLPKKKPLYKFFTSFKTALNKITYIKPIDIERSPSVDILASNIRNLLNTNNLAPSEEQIKIQKLLFGKDFIPSKTSIVILKGWYIGAEDNNWLKIITKDNKTQNVEQLSSIDVANHFNNPSISKNRFLVYTTDSLYKICSSATTLNKNSECLEYPQLSDGRNSLNGILQIEQKGSINITLQTDEKEYLEILSLLSKGQKVTIWSLIFLILIFLLKYFLKKIKLNNNLLVITLSLWLVLITRITLLVLVDITSFPGVTQLYLLPCYPLLILSLFLTLILITRNETNNINALPK